MTAKTSAFAGQLKHFAQTVDIVLPLSCRNRIGVFCVESAEYIEITGVATAAAGRLSLGPAH